MELFVQLIVNALIAGAITLLVALGFGLTYNATRFFNLAHGALCTVGGYATFASLHLWGIPAFFSILIGIVAAGGIGVLIDLIVYQPLRKRHVSSMVLLLASLGVMTALQAAIAMIFSSQFKSLVQGVSTSVSYTFLGATITHIQIIIILAAFIVFGLFALFMSQTRFGRTVRAISDDEEVAKIVGIDTDSIMRWVFFIGSALAGLAGIMFGYDMGIEPTMGFSLLVVGVTGAIVGGIKSMWGVLLGSFFVTAVQNFGIWKISGEWKFALAFIVLILFLLIRPEGIIKRT